MSEVMRYLHFKCEDEDETGEPIGPVSIMEHGKLPTARPYNPNREVEWVTLTEAHHRAKELGIALEVL